MSKEPKAPKTFKEPEEKQPSLADLMANAAAVNANVDQQEYEKSRQAAMDEYDLIERGSGGAGGASKKATAEIEQLKARIKELEAENAGLKAQLPEPPVIPAAPVAPVVPAVPVAPNPFADGVA